MSWTGEGRPDRAVPRGTRSDRGKPDPPPVAAGLRDRGPLSLPLLAGSFSAPETAPFPVAWPHLQGCNGVSSASRAENVSDFPLSLGKQRLEHTLGLQRHTQQPEPTQVTSLSKGKSYHISGDTVRTGSKD